MKHLAVSVVALAIFAGAAVAQDTTIVGNVQFRWRERALGVLPSVGGVQSTALPVGAVAAAPNFTSGGTNALDATYHLILECFVTNTVAGPNPCRGFRLAPFNVVSNDLRTRANFAGSPLIGSDPPPATGEVRNSAIANTFTSGVTLPSGATQLPGETSSTGHGMFAPFRGLADVAGSIDSPAVGVQNDTPGPLASMEMLTPLLDTSPFNQPADNSDPENPIAAGPYHQQYQYSGLGQWTPLFYVVLNLTDVTALRTVDVNLVVVNAEASDAQLRGWRGISNSGGVGDSWRLALQGSTPTFRITHVPAPNAAAVLGVCGLTAFRRSRRR